MTNPFSLSELVPNWVKATEILKGDLPGHTFHGNQYAAAMSSTALMAKANELDKLVNDDGGDAADHSGDHDEMADEHHQLSQELAAKAEEAASPEQKQALLEASEAHSAASLAHSDAVLEHEKAASFQQHYHWINGPEYDEPVGHMEATYAAAQASQRANELTWKAAQGA